MTMQAQTPPPPPPRQPLTTQIPIPSSVLQAVYASDQEMYPVALSYARLCAWVDACPDLSICFQNGTAATGEESAAAVAGVVIVLPLKRVYWEALLAGRLKEPEIEPESMFPACEGGHGEGRGEEGRDEVGLHVYHIERFGSWAEGAGRRAGRKGFAQVALEEVMNRVQANKWWKVVGWSALTATPAGKRAFERLGFLPTGYRELFVANVSEDGSSKQPLEMVCQFPGEQSPPEMDFSRGGILSMSEMAVKHGDLFNLV